MLDMLAKDTIANRSGEPRRAVVEFGKGSLDGGGLRHEGWSQTCLQNTRKLVGAQAPQNPVLMRSIGDQVAAYRKAHKLSTSDLAHAIGGNVKRQHIEQLEAAPNRIPKYIGKLAEVMGTTVDEMLAAAKLAAPRSRRPSSAVAERIREERATDPYELIERGLAALLIVSHSKDEVMAVIRKHAEVAEEMQRAFEERMRQEHGKP